MALRGRRSSMKRAARYVASAKRRVIRGGYHTNAPPKHERCTLMRGGYELPHQAQTLQRDLPGETIDSHRGQSSYAYSSEKPIGVGYKIIVKQPGAASLAWTAFRDVDEFKKFCKAYGLKVKGSLAPGSSFELKIPSKPRMQKLRCKGR